MASTSISVGFLSARAQMLLVYHLLSMLVRQNRWNHRQKVACTSMEEWHTATKSVQKHIYTRSIPVMQAWSRNWFEIHISRNWKSLYLQQSKTEHHKNAQIIWQCFSCTKQFRVQLHNNRRFHFHHTAISTSSSCASTGTAFYLYGAASAYSVEGPWGSSTFLTQKLSTTSTHTHKSIHVADLKGKHHICEDKRQSTF